MRQGVKRASVGLLCMLGLVAGLAAAPAQAAFDDPLFIYRPEPPPPPVLPPFIPPPAGQLEGPCGLAVDDAGHFYVSDYYHHAVDVFTPGKTYIEQIANEDPTDGPCGLAIGPDNSIYVNNYHRNVVKFSTVSGPGTVIAGVGATAAAPEDTTHPTGVAVDRASGDVYVDERTQVTVYDSAGAELRQLGVGSLLDGYGVAVSEYGPTAGFLYVPDAATDTVKVYDPATSATDPVATIDGAGTPAGHFTSLRDGAIALDRVSGEIYVADNLNPDYTYHPEAVVYVFDPAGPYKGRLKYSVEDALAVGLAVDNSATATQGRVYLTSGNSELAAVYAYPPGAATSAAVALPGAPGPSGDSAAPAAPAVASTAALGPVVGDSAPAGVAAPAPVKAQRPSEANRRHRAAKHRAAKHRAAKHAQKGNR